eukprot:s1216_g1.t1
MFHVVRVEKIFAEGAQTAEARPEAAASKAKPGFILNGVEELERKKDPSAHHGSSLQHGVIDCSTNGTFLNGFRLPPKTTGKVLLSHGDELLLQDPANGDQEFGYVVNIQELNVRERAKLQAPRRLLTTEESATMGRDFN